MVTEILCPKMCTRKQVHRNKKHLKKKEEKEEEVKNTNIPITLRIFSFITYSRCTLYEKRTKINNFLPT